MKGAGVVLTPLTPGPLGAVAQVGPLPAGIGDGCCQSIPEGEEREQGECEGVKLSDKEKSLLFPLCIFFLISSLSCWENK